MERTRSNRVLVAGATGYIGGGVAHGLRAAGFSIRALTRDAARFTPIAPTDEVVVAEATDRDSLRGACDGIDVVFSSIGIRGFDRRPTLWEVDYQANINLLDEARRAGVRHFIFISVIHGPMMARVSPIAEAREMVARAVIDSGIPYTIYRPTGFFNDMAEFLDSAARRGVVWILGDGEGRMNPLSALDMGDEVARAIRDPRRHNTVVPIGGPEVFTHREVAELAFRALRRPPNVRSIPRWALRGAARALKPFHGNAHGLLTFFDFIAGTPDMRGEPVGHRRLEPFFERCASGLNVRLAELSLEGAREDQPQRAPADAPVIQA